MADSSTHLPANMLASMVRVPTVPEGWDIAMHFSETAVQSLFHSNWDSDGEEQHNITWVAPGEVEGHHEIVQITAPLNPPKVTLNSEKQQTSLGFDVVSGEISAGKIPSETVPLLLMALQEAPPQEMAATTEKHGVQWEHKATLSPQEPLCVDDQVPIGSHLKSNGIGYDIGLNIAKTSMTLSGSEFGRITSHEQGEQVSSWAKQQDITGKLGHLIPLASTAPDEIILQPNYVGTRVVTGTSGAPLLQVLASSKNASQDVPQQNVIVPHSSDHDFSLMVSSQAAMNMVVEEYNLGSGDIKVVTLPPQNGEPHWFIEVHEPMVFEGSFGIDGEKTPLVTQQSSMRMRFGGSPHQGLEISTYIEPSSDITLDILLAGNFPPTIKGAGTNHALQLSSGPQSVTANGFYEEIVKPQLETFLTADIKGDMTRVKMKSLTALTQSSLELSGHQLDYQIAAFPGEFVVAGALSAT